MGTPTYPWVDALLHGQLEELLTKWRAEGASVREIAERVTERLPEGISVHYVTVHRWCDRLGIEKQAKAS